MSAAGDSGTGRREPMAARDGQETPMDAGRATVTVAKAIVCAAAVVTVYLISTVRLDRGSCRARGRRPRG
nr:hypothetical protein GCM10025730_18560 [Promicromonospora thailandica]